MTWTVLEHIPDWMDVAKTCLIQLNVKGNFSLYSISRECSRLPMRWYSLLHIVMIHYHKFGK